MDCRAIILTPKMKSFCTRAGSPAKFPATAFDTFLPKELQRPPAKKFGVVRGRRQLVYTLAAVPTKLHLLMKQLFVGAITRAR